MSMSVNGELARQLNFDMRAAPMKVSLKEAVVAEEPPQAAEHACHARLMRAPLFL
ncbi:MAG: hypothetical protein H0T75_22645, partial [Rhizobiales bacterium]|nr:hypothetical protein [Hyphomicrobiales bacterium]